MFQRRKEMEFFSRVLERLLNGEQLDFPLEYKDELPAKIQYQLLRLSEKIYGNERPLKKERDEIRELIAEIAHQMRNPLANLESYLELMYTAEDETERQSYLEILKNTESQLHFLTESFIKMARLENRIIQIKPDSTNLSATILQSILQVKKAAENKKIFIDFTSEEAIETPHDANWLGEAVFNILENSVKYSPCDSVIDVSVSRNEMYTRIAVEDSGTGICEGEEALIFQRFYRGRETQGKPGFGLGLYLSRELVFHHGGFIKARRKKQGLEIIIFLP